MTPIELLAILILAGAIIVLLYYYLQNQGYLGAGRPQSQVYELADKGTVESGSTSQMGERFSGVGEKMSGVGEKVSDVSDRIVGKVKEVPLSTDILSNKIDAFLEEKSDELIEDWDLATKTDIKDLEQRMDVVTRDISELERRFNEYRGFTNKKLDHLDERLKALEEEEE